jgi:aryl-alcohol dehydrogenase-like predicted oxidoreductase
MTNHDLDASAAGTFQLGDLTVNRLGFGAMRITGPGVWGPPADRETAKAVLIRAVALGVNLIDTADSYGPEVSEELIAEALYPYPHDLVIATKGGYLRHGPNQWQPDGRPIHLRAALEGSLLRLKRDYIDVYQLHTPDPQTPFAESVGVLAEMQAEGKIRHIGLSNVSVAQLKQAQAIVKVVSVQNRYNLADRASEDVLDACAEQGLGFIPWYPLATGNLARPGSQLDQIASRHNVAPGQVALAWLLWRSPVMLPIPGTGSIAHLEENVAAAALKLDEAELAALAG